MSKRTGCHMENREVQYCTTKKQEAQLEELGISPDSADLYRIPKVGGYRITSEWSVNAKPCWSLAGLLAILPQQITDKNDCLVYDRFICGDVVDYRCIDYELYGDCYSEGTLFENIITCIKDFKEKGYISKQFIKDGDKGK